MEPDHQAPRLSYRGLARVDDGGGAGRDGVDAVQSQLTPEGTPAAGGGGMFRVRPEHVPAVVAGLEEAIRELNSISRQAHGLQTIGGPGDDQFSAQAAREIARQAGEEPGRHGWANRLYREALQATIDNLQAQLDAYQRAEGDTAASWQGS